MQLRASAELPTGDAPFLRRLILRADFGISNARWARPRTQMKVNALSARARLDKKQVEQRAADRVDAVLSRVGRGCVLERRSGVAFPLIVPCARRHGHR